MWRSTVRTIRLIISAISRLLRPAASARKTSASRAVSARVGRGAAGDGGTRSQRGEQDMRLIEQRLCGLGVTRIAPEFGEGNQCAGALER